MISELYRLDRNYLFTFTRFYSASGPQKMDSTFDRAFGLRPSSAAAWPERKLIPCSAIICIVIYSPISPSSISTGHFHLDLYCICIAKHFATLLGG